MATTEESIQTEQATKELDEVFCSTCGKAIKRQAVICVHCGVPTGVRPITGSERKSKVVAIVLAVFFGFFAWLYTYQKDKVKFWINLPLSIITLGIWWVTVGWLWPIIDLAIKPNSFYENYPN